MENKTIGKWNKILTTKQGLVLKARSTGYMDNIQYQYFEGDKPIQDRYEVVSISQLKVFKDILKVMNKDDYDDWNRKNKNRRFDKNFIYL